MSRWIVVLAVLSSLAGCGGGGDDPDAAPPENKPTPLACAVEPRPASCL